ncbi:flagellar basal-body rod protein FlgG [Xylophilus rhododendri]|uniref:Flagellar basal-body rod protein FlgG n=1 Tax=Xylophilus rhododendri TaxID=2697032 RepID=A0A857J838_9BURK|nr:flagellar basal-body rod protein FlgG [Xylophilus rhododendri]QHI99172.1 flagellar basal-body rod protein FlgG [Xylophilus rhododendri]
MLDALSISATGLQAQQLSIDTIANNLANLNTPAYKKTRVSFTDLVSTDAIAAQRAAMADPLADPRLPLQAGGGAARLGDGVGIATLAKLFDAGPLNQTDSAWDLAIQGDGFLPVLLADGSLAYSRGGSLKTNADGQLATLSGQALKPGIAIPPHATSLSIAADGQVSAVLPHQSRPAQLGQIELVRFANPAGLTALGDGLYKAGDSAGEPIAGMPGQEGLGTLQQGFLESSNVKMSDEMVDLMIARRAYEASLKVMQAADEMLGLVNNLRK